MVHWWNDTPSPDVIGWLILCVLHSVTFNLHFYCRWPYCCCCVFPLIPAEDVHFAIFSNGEEGESFTQGSVVSRVTL